MTFLDIIGHEQQILQMQSAMEQDRIPHAFLFRGPDGIGKKTIALTFAKALNCLKGAPNACDSCASCRKADHGNHLDIILLEPEGQFIKVQAIREFQERLKFRSWEGRKRVCIIDEADRMNEVAANALLKTLEEPPPDNVIILVTSRPHQLPPTILSRCQQLRFSPLPEERVAEYLQTALAEEAESARQLAASAGGSIAWARAMHSAAFLQMRRDICDWVATGAGSDPLERLAGLNRFGSKREDVLERLSVLRTIYRDALVYKETGARDMLINQDREDIVGLLAERSPVQGLLSDIRAVDRAWHAVEQNADKTLTLEVMLLRLSEKQR